MADLRSRRPTPDLRLAAVGGLTGLALTGLALFRWGPESVVRLAAPEQVLERTAEDARRLRVVVVGAPRLRVGFDLQVSESWELEHLVAVERDPAVRRQLMSQVPPVRLIARYQRAFAEDGTRGRWIVEYDGSARPVLVAFNSSSMPGMAQNRHDAETVGNRLADFLLGQEPPVPEVSGVPAIREFLYRPHGEATGINVQIVGANMWFARRQMRPYTLSRETLLRALTPESLLFAASSLAIGLLGAGVLVWRLTHRRVGLAGLTVPVVTLLLALLCVVWLRFGDGVAAFFLTFLQQAFIALSSGMIWIVGEAELREARPGSVEHLDRLRTRQPLRATGRNVISGVGIGMLLSGLLTALPVITVPLGGGYGRPVQRIPDDVWLGPLGLGLLLCGATAFLVGLGGRLAGSTGALTGACVSSLAWSLAVPVTPVHWSLIFGLLAALPAALVLWNLGLAALLAATLTAASLPTLMFSLAHPDLMLSTALVASSPLVALLAGGWLVARAPEHRDSALAEPAYVSRLEQEARMAAELDLLRRLQLAMLPPADAPEMPGVDAAWSMVPAHTIGGDLVDLFRDASGRLWIAVADAAGHGLSCSIMTAMTKAAILDHAVAGLGPAEALAAIRPLFLRLRGERIMVTLLLVVWDPERRELAAASAGHPPLLVFDGAAVRELGNGGPPLGVRLGGGEHEESLRSDRGLALVAWTDGIPETLSPEGEPYGFERWKKMLPRLSGRPAVRILDELLADVVRHRSDRPVDDDVTALVVKIDGHRTPRS